MRTHLNFSGWNATFIGLIALCLLLFSGIVHADAVGDDLLPVFARAHAGQPLRVVVLGGSITQAGKGWITDWLVEQFPKSAVMMHNAGMSATGSQLGVFRLARDVINFQPDLVMIEYAVNDGGQSDEKVIRYVESIVVRLKSLAHPPAIVFLEAAARNGSNRARHQKVAKHYGLLDIDLQVAVDAHLQSPEITWSQIMSDAVHPNEQGHAFYSKVIAEKLLPYVQQARNDSLDNNLQTKQIPTLSTKPLILDGMLMPIGPSGQWKQLNALPQWWNRFFNGVVRGQQPGSELTIAVRGRMIGVFYAMDSKDGGLCYINVDGAMPHVIDTSSRGGYSYSLLGEEMQPCEHIVKIAVAKPLDKPVGNVDLGYILVAGQEDCTKDLAPQQSIDIAAIAGCTFETIPAANWQWSGPYGGTEKTDSFTADFDTVFVPENQASEIQWQQGQGDQSKIDFAQLTGWSDRGVCYARTNVKRAMAGKTMLALRLDYFAKVFVNGKLVHTIDRSVHGGMSPMTPILLPVQMQAGDNQILIKVHSGSRGNMFALFIQTEK